MDQVINSDVTMLASEMFDGILHRIQSSRLNFNIQLTPFSALISIKKSFVTDKSGAVVLPDNAIQDNAQNKKLNVLSVSQLERSLNDLQKNYTKSVGDYTDALETIQKLEDELVLRGKIIKSLELDLAKSREMTSKLNIALNESSIKHKEEKSLILKEHKAEVKMWRKDLGEANRKHIKLEKKFDMLSTVKPVAPTKQEALGPDAILP